MVYDGEERVRCRCGAFASSSDFVNENSGEMISCHCSKCGLRWEEGY